MEVISDSEIKLKTAKRDTVRDSIRDSVPVEGTEKEIIVPWTLANSRRLSDIGVRNVSPIIRDYDFVARFEPMPHQLRMADFLSRHRRAYCLADLGCVDADTEYLSPAGWKRIADYDGGMVAQYDPDGDRYEFVEPTEYVKKPCSQMLQFIMEDKVDQLLSPEHRMIVRLPGDSQYAVVQAADVAARVTRGEAVQVPGRNMRDWHTLKSTGIWWRPSPMGKKYCFMVPTSFLILRRNGCVFVTGNTGKTISAIWAAEYLRQEGFISKILVVAPKAVMRAAWCEELLTHMPMVPYSLLHDARKKRIQKAKGNTPWKIINYEGVSIVRPELMEWAPDLIIADESTNCKNETTNKWSALNSLVTNDTMLWFLTGTPAPQGPPDAYGQLRMMNNNSQVPRTRSQFLLRTMKQVSEYKWVPKQGSEKYVFSLMKPAFRVEKRDVLTDLPEMTFLDREVELSKDQKRHFREVQKEMKTEALGMEITAANAAVKLSKLCQIAAGSVYASSWEDAENERPIVDFPINARIKATVEAIEQSNSKTLILFEHRHTLERVSAEITKAGYSVEIVHGGVSLKERQRILSDFNKRSKPHVICAIARTMSHGITATGASTTIWFSPILSVETYLQANNRTDRPGQKHAMSVVHIYASAVERELYKRLSAKKDNQESLLELYNQAMSGL